MSYATNADVAAYLGRSLTSLQQTQADLYLSAASAWIDQYTGRVWNPSSPVTEIMNIFGPLLYTKVRPVTAITSIKIRDIEPGSDETTLVADDGYELVDPARGVISLGIVVTLGGPNFIYPRYHGYFAEVVYTHGLTACPDNIKLAAIILAASKMTIALNPMQSGVRSFSDNRAISVTFADAKSGTNDQGIPIEVLGLLPPKQAFIV